MLLLDVERVCVVTDGSGYRFFQVEIPQRISLPVDSSPTDIVSSGQSVDVRPSANE